jgi:drug/metabolite transporter (DMT)-like permease
VLSRVKLTPFDFALYATVVLAWGLAWIVIHFQVGVVAPDVSVLWRFLVAGIIMLVIAAIRGDRLSYSFRSHVMFALLGLLMFSVNFLLFYHAAETLPSGLLSIVFSLASFINVWLSALFLKLPVDRRVVAGGLLGTAGMAALFYPQFAGHAFPRGALIALGLSLAGTLAFCFANTVSAGISARNYPVFASTGFGMLYGSIGLAIYALMRGHAFTVEWTPVYLGGLVYLALISSVLAFACYLTLLGRIGADRAAYVTVLGPVVALAVSTVVENFQWSLVAALGLVAVLIGNVLVLRPART